MTFLEQVAEFHRVFLIPDAQEPTFDPVVMELRYRLMREEAEEYYDAKSPKDALDGLLDFAYVHAGSVLQLGLKNSYSAHYDARYPAPGAVREDMLSLCERFKLYANPELTLADMQHELGTLVKEEGFEGIFEEAFARVQEANLGKQWETEEVFTKFEELGLPVLRGAITALPEGVPMKIVDGEWEFEYVRPKWVVKFNGKIKKPGSWQPPVFDDLLQTVTA